MTTSDRGTPDLAPLRDVDVDLDSLFAALADSNRRFVVSCLDDHPYSLTVRDLATRLAAWKAGVPVDDVPAGEFETSYLLLYHRHIPRLAEANVVEYERDRGTVRLREGGDEPRVSAELAKFGERVDASQTAEG